MNIRERSFIAGYGRVDDRVAHYMNDHQVDIYEACYAVGYNSVEEAMSTPEEKEWDDKIKKMLEVDGFHED